MVFLSFPMDVAIDSANIEVDVRRIPAFHTTSRRQSGLRKSKLGETKGLSLSREAKSGTLRSPQTWLGPPSGLAMEVDGVLPSINHVVNPFYSPAILSSKNLICWLWLFSIYHLVI